MHEPIDPNTPIETHPSLMELFGDLIQDLMNFTDMNSDIERFISALQNARPRPHASSGFMEYFTTLRFIGERLEAMRGVCQMLSAIGQVKNTIPTRELLSETREDRLHRMLLVVDDGKAWAMPSVTVELRGTWRANRFDAV